MEGERTGKVSEGREVHLERSENELAGGGGVFWLHRVPAGEKVGRTLFSWAVVVDQSELFCS